MPEEARAFHSHSGLPRHPKSRLNNPPPLPPPFVPKGSPFLIASSTQPDILARSLMTLRSSSLSVMRSARRPPKLMSVGMLLTPHSTPRSIILPLLVSGLSSSTSVNARAENLSSGLVDRLFTSSVRRGVMVRHGAQPEVVKRASSRVLLAETRRR